MGLNYLQECLSLISEEDIEIQKLLEKCEIQKHINAKESALRESNLKPILKETNCLQNDYAIDNNNLKLGKNVYKIFYIFFFNFPIQFQIRDVGNKNISDGNKEDPIDSISNHK